MQNEYRFTDSNDFNAIANTFTQGLRELPTDYVARVKNFLAEYLGSSRHPVPFGGRVKDFEVLDDWLADTQASSYLLLAAPAGRGKSALLLRWCQRLFVRRDVAVAYFPVSIRFRTNLAGVAFPALVALLARLHGEKVPADPNTHEEVWRGLLVEYMTRPLPDGRSLVLVLDGVDEAADWAAGPGLFPLNPPPGLRVVLSARYLANDQDADAWLKRLGWTRPGLARTLELFPLDRTGIASVLVQMGFPLDLLGTRVNIVSELYRLSEGDPLLVRLYVDDLWERGEAAVRLQPEDLRAIRPGLAGYFERWWKEQRLLWSQEAPRREAAAQSVLNLLAGALGPLSKDDILSLLPDEAGFKPENLDQHLASLARFVTGDGVRQGYVFSHPRLGNYFLEERLSEEERQEVEHRFLSWGEQTLLALNEGRLAPEDASNYIIQYYGAHLERAQADPYALLALVSDGWRRAWEKLDRANAGFLSDVERAWRAAAHEDAATTSAGNMATYLGEEILCLLSQVSVNSVTSNISPRLMLEAVKTRIWTAAQGLASIRLITDLAPRARELVGLAPYVQEPLRTDILQEALDTVATIKDEYARLDALVALAPGLSEELLWQVLEVLPTVEDEADRAGVLAELAPSLAAYTALVERSLDFVQEMEEEEYRALALEGLASCLSENQQGRVLRLVREIQEERYRAQTLMALVPHLSESLLQEILQEARVMQDGLSRIRLLTELVTYLTVPLKAEVVQEALELEREIEDREYRIEVLVKLAPFLPVEKFQQALREIQLLWDESYRASALSDLVQYTPEELLPELQQAVLTMKSEEARTKVLLQLFPRLSEELLAQTLGTIQTTWDEGRRAELLAQFALYVSDDLLPHLLEIIPTIEDQGYRVWLLTELEAPLTGRLDEAYFSIAAVFNTINEKEERLQTLLAIAPRLSTEALAKIFSFMLPEVFGFTWRIRDEEQRAHILVKLGDHLPDDMLSTALNAIRALSNEIYQVQALVALAPRIGELLLSDALDIVRGMKHREKRSQVLEVLVSSLPEERKGERVQEMLQVLQVIKDEAERTRIVVASAPYMQAKLPSSKAQIVVEAVRAMRDEKNQVQILTVLASRMPEDTFEDVLEVAQKLQSEEERAVLLEALAPYVAEKFFPHFLSTVQTLQVERWRTQVLATVVAQAPKSIITGMLAMAQNMQDEYQRAEVLGALAPHVDEASFSHLWRIVQAIPDEGRRVWILGALALRAPESFFPQLWEAIWAISNEGWQLWILRALAAHLSESMFSQIWEKVLTISDEERRAHMMVILVPHVPERFFSQVWAAVQKLHDTRMRWHMLEALAHHVPKDVFAPFFKAVRSISYDAFYVQVLETLAPRVPEDSFSRFFAAVQGIVSVEMRMQVFEALLPHVPAEHFSEVWKAVRVIKNEGQRTKMLTILAPCIPARFFLQVWEVVLAMDNVTLRARALQALLPYLTQEQLVTVLEIVQTMPYIGGQIEFLEALVPYLSQEKYVEVLEALLPLPSGENLAELLMQANGAEKWWLRVLAVLAPHLPEERSLALLPTLLKAIQALKGEEDRVWLLTKLASHVPETLLPEMLNALWTIEKQPSRIQALQALLSSLSQEGWAHVLAWIAEKMQADGDTTFTIQVLLVADTLVPQSSPALLYPVLRETLSLLAQRTRHDTLPHLAQLAPAIRVAGGQEAITEACCAALEVGCWWP